MAFIRTIVAGAGALALIGSSAFAAGPSPKGTWLSATGESRYKVELCGDGTALCAKLVWLRGDALTPESQPYLGTYLVNEAQQVAPNAWRGAVHVQGKTLTGTITLVDETSIQLTGCLYYVFCKSFMLSKVKG